MLKKIFGIALGTLAVTAYAAPDASGVVNQQHPQSASVSSSVSQTPGFHSDSVTSTTAPANNPTVNSLMYSGSQFPEQNKLTGTQHEKYYTSQELKHKINNPNVNSMLYSGSQFPQQNQLTGSKHQKYYTSQERKQQKNNPFVNSRLYSGAQFPQQNSLSGDEPAAKSANGAQ
jgi:hypothetical protein